MFPSCLSLPVSESKRLSFGTTMIFTMGIREDRSLACSRALFSKVLSSRGCWRSEHLLGVELRCREGKVLESLIGPWACAHVGPFRTPVGKGQCPPTSSPPLQPEWHWEGTSPLGHWGQQAAVLLWTNQETVQKQCLGPWSESTVCVWLSSWWYL